MKTCARNIRRKSSTEEKTEGKKKEDCSGNGSVSSDALKLPSLSLLLSLSALKKKGERKKSRAPQSLGTAASQILVLNDVRSMAFVESHSLCSALETQS